MIERLQGFPDNVIAFAGRGRVTKADYELILDSGGREGPRRP